MLARRTSNDHTLSGTRVAPGAEVDVSVRRSAAQSIGHRLGLLRHADFRRLWVGETISQFGSQVSLLAIPYIATVLLQATPFEVALRPEWAGEGDDAGARATGPISSRSWRPPRRSLRSSGKEGWRPFGRFGAWPAPGSTSTSC